LNSLSISIDEIKKSIESIGYKVVSIKGEIEIEDIESRIPLKEEVTRLKKVVLSLYYHL